jgi:hypothetical protein
MRRGRTGGALRRLHARRLQTAARTHARIVHTYRPSHRASTKARLSAVSLVGEARLAILARAVACTLPTASTFHGESNFQRRWLSLATGKRSTAQRLNFSLTNRRQINVRTYTQLTTFIGSLFSSFRLPRAIEKLWPARPASQNC